MGKWKKLDPVIGKLYGGELVNITENLNNAEWTDKVVDVTKAKSTRYWVRLDSGEEVFFFGSKMLNQLLKGITPGDLLVVKYEGKFPMGKLDGRNIPYEQHLWAAVYKKRTISIEQGAK